jgi:hypothetical protein
MQSCETCRYRRGFALFPAEIGWCRAVPPKLVDPNSSAWPPVQLAGWCGWYRFSWRAWWRKGKEG